MHLYCLPLCVWTQVCREGDPSTVGLWDVLSYLVPSSSFTDHGPICPVGTGGPLCVSYIILALGSHGYQQLRGWAPVTAFRGARNTCLLPIPVNRGSTAKVPQTGTHLRFPSQLWRLVLRFRRGQQTAIFSLCPHTLKREKSSLLWLLI